MIDYLIEPCQLPGSILVMTIYRGKLIVATDQGVFIVNTDGSFEKVEPERSNDADLQKL